METRHGFTLMSAAEFPAWLAGQTVSRTITAVQQHHTWSPSYAHFGGGNHFALQRGMKNHHVNNNGWADIGQHFTIFPDGTVMTGRPLARSPACIAYRNAGSVCIENLGDFDAGRDAMTPAQEQAIVRVTAALLARFGLGAPSTRNVVYHHWFDLNTGTRTNGLSGSTKSCPGTAFFGGNKVGDCEANFLPKVAAAMGGAGGGADPLPRGYACVTVDSLTVRTGPGVGNPPVAGIGPARLGTILRVFAETAGWLRIAASKSHWVSGSRTTAVTRRRVNTADTNCRTGPGTRFPVVMVLNDGEEVFVHEVRDGWSRVSLDQQWIRSTLLT